MSLEANKFRLGVFFFLSSILFIAAMVWLTGWFRSEKTHTYVCYFDESVQGLEDGSTVRYNGVPVGKVDHIGVAPEGRLVEVVVSLEASFPVGDDIAARLDFVGITGLRVVNLRRPDADDITVQDLSFNPKYPVIPVQRSQLEQLDIGLQRFLQVMAEIDFAAIGSKSVRFLDNLNTFMEGEELAMLMDTAGHTTNHLDSLITVYLDLGRKLDGLAGEFASGVPGIREDIEEIVLSVSELSEGVRSMSFDFNSLVSDLEELIGEISTLIARIGEDPGSFLFGRPQEEDRWP